MEWAEVRGVAELLDLIEPVSSECGRAYYQRGEGHHLQVPSLLHMCKTERGREGRERGEGGEGEREGRES